MFSCGHPAAHHFRNEACSLSTTRLCHIKDTDSWLRFPCRRCIIVRQANGIKVKTAEDAVHDEYNDVWHIPSRCFVDVGFRTLDPFREDKLEPVSPCSPAPTILSPTSRSTSAWSHFTKDDRSKCAKLLSRVMKFRKVSPCCEERQRRGAYPAVRLEGRENRIEGRVMDDHCQSME
jgi:hypothetical protein